jgi:hydroxyacyl-ACP dehydratase HTD2-like protein with hotdog domain
MNKSILGLYYEDFVIGDEIQHSLSKTIFESDNNFFSLLTMNHHPVHTNMDYAAKNQHGKILVVGTLVFSLAVGITVPDISGKAIANLEYESIKHYKHDIEHTKNKNENLIEKNQFNDSIIKEKKLREKKKSDSDSTIPILENVTSFFQENNYTKIEAEKFFNYFESNGWLVGGKTKMKNWKAAAKTW